MCRLDGVSNASRAAVRMNTRTFSFSQWTAKDTQPLVYTIAVNTLR